MKNRPTLTRERYTWHQRQQDMDLWTRPQPIFGQDEPITIHQAGEKLMRETLSAQRKDGETWKSKVVVNDTRTYFHRCAPDTEQTMKGPKASNQLARLQGLLKDQPLKHSLRKPNLALKDIPPLNVVLNPSVDTQAREAGKLQYTL